MIEARIKSEDLKKLSKKGKGTEGTVYKASKRILYKVYRAGLDTPVSFNQANYSVQNIIEAASRQPLVKHSTLPLGPLYIDGKFAGCLLKYHRGYINIHNIGMLPKKLKLSIIRKIIMYVKELTDNHIYPLDLANKKGVGNQHSNILISLSGDIQIIDLDGRSTQYTSEFNQTYYEMSLCSLLSLLTDLLFDIEYVIGDTEDEELEYYAEKLSRNGLSENLVTMIRRQDGISYEALNQMVDEAEHVKRLVL